MSERSVSRDLGGVLTDSEHCSDVAIAEVSRNAQTDQFTLTAPESPQFRVHLAQAIALFGDQLDAPCRHWRAADAGEELAHTTASPVVVDAQTVSDANQPRPQVSGRATTLVYPERAEEGFMGEILSDAEVADLAEAEPVDVAGVLAVQLREVWPVGARRDGRGALPHALLTPPKAPR